MVFIVFFYMVTRGVPLLRTIMVTATCQPLCEYLNSVDEKAYSVMYHSITVTLNMI